MNETIRLLEKELRRRQRKADKLAVLLKKHEGTEYVNTYEYLTIKLADTSLLIYKLQQQLQIVRDLNR